MNDTELDEMLDQWSVPPAPASLRERVRAGFAASPPQTAPPSVPVRWRWAFAPGLRKALPAACMIGVGAFLWMVTQALSQTPPPARIPYTVDSEFVRYSENGSQAVEMYSTSYYENGHEIILSRSFPGHPFQTAFGSTLDAVHRWQQLVLPFFVNAELRERARARASERAADLLRAGCVDGAVVGRETILNYPTTAVERRLSDRLRMTTWMAPGLGCFALRFTTEEQGLDGTFHLATVKQALKVTLNP